MWARKARDGQKSPTAKLSEKSRFIKTKTPPKNTETETHLSSRI